jgi:HD-like signal output (HDOD) protein
MERDVHCKRAITAGKSKQTALHLSKSLLKALGMNDLLLNRIVRSPTLPALPQVAVDVLNVGNGGANAVAVNAKLSEVISQDQSLTERLLLAANSTFYANTKRCDNIAQALDAIGPRAVKVLAIGLSMIKNLLQTQRLPFSAQDFSRRVVFCASAARLSAQLLEPAQVEACFLAALLMDIGVVLMGDALGAEYAQVLTKAGDHSRLESTEREVLDLTHAEVAGSVARYWKLPDVLQIPIAKHHCPQSVPAGALRTLAEMASLAGQCADIFVGDDPAGSIADVRRLLAVGYDIDQEEADKLIADLDKAAIALCPAFDLPIDQNFTLEAVWMRASQRPKNSAADGHDGRERRRSGRVCREGSLLIRPCMAGVLAGQVRVKFRDVSSTGIGFTHEIPMAPGAEFIVELPGKNVQKTILYTVVRCVPGDNGQFHIGAKMVPEQPGAVATTKPTARPATAAV